MRVLVAYDGGAAGEKAMQAIASWVQESSAEVHVVQVLNPKTIHETVRPATLHVVTPAATSTGSLLYAEEPPAVLAEDRTQALDSTLTETAERIKEMAGRHVAAYPVTAHVVLGSEPAQEIIRLASSIAADLIAVGAHGRTGVAHALLGSVAESVVRQSALPVLVVGPKAG
jgi:universal stress protein A